MKYFAILILTSFVLTVQCQESTTPFTVDDNDDSITTFAVDDDLATTTTEPEEETVTLTDVSVAETAPESEPLTESPLRKAANVRILIQPDEQKKPVSARLDEDQLRITDSQIPASRTQLRAKSVGGSGVFNPTSVGGSGQFDGSVIGGEGSFPGSQVGGSGVFGGSSIGGQGSFTGSQVGGSGQFDGGVVGGQGSFTGSQVGGSGQFDGGVIGGQGSFTGSANNDRAQGPFTRTFNGGSVGSSGSFPVLANNDRAQGPFTHTFNSGSVGSSGSFLGSTNNDLGSFTRPTSGSSGPFQLNFRPQSVSVQDPISKPVFQSFQQPSLIQDSFPSSCSHDPQYQQATYFSQNRPTRQNIYWWYPSNVQDGQFPVRRNIYVY